MKSKSAQKVRLTSYDDLFGTSEPVSGEAVTSVPVSQLHPFAGHPFRVADDAKMQETVESVKQHGVLVPGIVRPYPDGGYEIISGHRRRRACELAGIEEMPVIIRDLDDDAATVIMVDANIQREDILPSEKAKAYKMKYEAMKHQGSKGEKFTADAVGEAAGESGRTVQRYIRLAELVPELLEYVDVKKISLVIGEMLSYLKTEEQGWLVYAVANSGVFPSKAQAERLKEESKAGKLTEAGIYAVLVKKDSGKVSVTISAKKLSDYFPPAYTKERMERVIYQLLEEWKQNGGKGESGDGEDTV